VADLDSEDADPERSELRSGQVLGGRYRITRELGRGGMSIVFEATSLKLGRRFAIKLPRSERPLTREARRRLEREITLGATLESSHIARVFDWDTDGDGTPFVVMEYVPGEDLRRVLARTGPLPLRRAVNLMLQVCRGLAVAHRQGVIHRDLKPSNLAVTPELGGYEHCTLLDFGVAKTAAGAPDGDSTRTGAMVGTLAYMPPEQIRGEKDLDARADLYALGAILYECLSGQRAFDADSQHALMYRILHERPPSLARLLPDLPSAVDSFMTRALAADRIERFQSVEELASALEKLLPLEAERVSVDADTLASEPGTHRAMLRSPARAQRRRALGIALGLVAFVVAVALVAPRGEPVDGSRPPAANERPAATVVVGTPGEPALAAPTGVAAARPEPSAEPTLATSAPSRAPVKPGRNAKAATLSPLPAAAPSAAPLDAGPAASSDPLKERGYMLVSPYGRPPSASFE
jgi:serine/threonine-protein kinase